MGRRCIVPSCPSTDLTMLVHRFPRKHCAAWQASLQLNSYSVKDLLDKYVVCAHHFRITDYRHKESKHLNTTAIPTLDDIPDADKIPDCRSSIHKTNKRSIVTTVASDSGPSHLNSNLPVGRTYSNCVTSSNVSSIPKLTGSGDTVEDDSLMEDRFYADGDMIEEETAMDEVMLLLDSDVSPTDVPECVSVNYEEEDGDEEEVVEDTFTMKEIYIDEMSEICDNNARVILNATDYVDVIGTNEEADYDNDDGDDDDGCELVDESEILFKDHSRKDLINELLASRSRIKELETKLENIQKAHMSMVQNLNNFNKVLIS